MTDSQDERTFWFVMRSTEIIGLIFLKYVEVRVRVVCVSQCPSSQLAGCHLSLSVTGRLVRTSLYRCHHRHQPQPVDFYLPTV